MLEYLAIGSLAVNVIVLLVVVFKGNGQASTRRLAGQMTSLERDVQRDLERIEKTIREQISESRDADNQSARMAREEQASALKSFSEVIQHSLAEGHVQTNHALANQHRSTLDAIGEMFRQHKALLDTFQKQLAELTAMNERKLEQVRDTVERKLTVLQEDNSKKLEQMRLTVDEKLHQTLEKRLGESFQLVSDRLELVHKGLGEMQTLASGVGDLKRVLTNVKTRGTLGEIQLENLLEQVLSPEQYQRNVAVKKGSQERVDFAIRLPGKDKHDKPVLLPIDAKFPLEDYQRLMDAQEAGDLAATIESAKLLENRIKQEAKSIQEKYLSPPNTTDFAIMFLPIEGLFAEVLRRSGLWDSLQREYRVVVTGPTTITALLNSLQLGFRTLAIQQRSSEVWKLLGAVKTEFGKFGDILEKTQKKLKEASNTIDSAASKSRAIERKLKKVEEVPALEVDEILEIQEGSVGD